MRVSAVSYEGEMMSYWITHIYVSILQSNCVINVSKIGGKYET